MALTVANPAVAVTQLARQNVGSPSAPGSANITHEFLYRTTHTKAQVEAAGYFNNARGRLNIGSIIKVVYGVGGTMGQEEYLISAVAPAADVAWTKAAAAGITDNSGGNAAAAAIAAGVGVQTLPFFLNLASIAANGDLLTDYVPGYRFKILAVDFRVCKPVTTAAKLASLNLEIGTTNLTGGVVALTSANATPAGVAVAGTAVTANNVGTATDAFSVEASGVTAFAEGDGWLLVKIQNLDTADALASLNAA